MKKVHFSFNCSITLVLAPWNINTPSTPNIINLEAILVLERPSYYIKFAIITLLRLHVIAPYNTFQLLQKKYVLPTFNHVNMYNNPPLVITMATSSMDTKINLID
jgi:hypothetical protein